MSHILTIQTEIRDQAAVEQACTRLELPAPVQGTHRLYSRSLTGLAIRLPGWIYPVVVDLQSGQAQYDNFEGRWGSQAELNRFVQSYAVTKATREAHRHGYSVREQQLADGSIQLTVQTGGAA